MESMINGVSNWLSCGSNVVDRLFFGDDKQESSSSSGEEDASDSIYSDDEETSSSSSTDDDDEYTNTTVRKTRIKNKVIIRNNSNKSSTTGNDNTGGSLYSWGNNYYGQCANLKCRSVVTLPSPVEQLINSQLRVISIATGDTHVMAIVSSQQLYGWGCNRWGQLGLGDQINRINPTLVSALSSPIKSVCCGSQHTMALTKFGDLFSWGCGTSGRLGHGNEMPELTPRSIIGFIGKPIQLIAAGMLHSVCMDTKGSIYTWGNNKFGQLGQGGIHSHNNNNPNTNNIIKKQTTPLRLKELDKIGVIKIVCGKNHTHALTSDGEVFSFGFNVCGQLGVGEYGDHFHPKKLALDEFIIDIASGFYHSLCITKNGNLYSWGYMSDGALGLGDVIGHQNKPKLIPKSHWNHNYSDSNDSWNHIYNNNNTNNNKNNNNQPEEGVEKIFAGAWNSALVTKSGKLYCFGYGDNFRNGNKSEEDQDIPCLIKGEEWGVEKTIDPNKILQEKRITTNYKSVNDFKDDDDEDGKEVSQQDSNNSNSNNTTIKIHTKVVDVSLGSSFTLAVVKNYTCK